MQGVIKAYEPSTGVGVVIADTDLNEYDLAEGALEGSVFRTLRQGQRVVFDLDAAGRAAAIRLGSEVDMGTPGFRRVRPAGDRRRDRGARLMATDTPTATTPGRPRATRRPATSA